MPGTVRDVTRKILLNADLSTTNSQVLARAVAAKISLGAYYGLSVPCYGIIKDIDLQ